MRKEQTREYWAGDLQRRYLGSRWTEVSRGRRCFGIVDDIGHDLYDAGIEPMHDGELCGYRYATDKSSGEWWLSPGRPREWARAMEWLPSHVARLLQAHAVLYPSYWAANNVL